ncbi:MAG: S8 family serine peptidase, partial [Prosthecobacter sp.]|nr:S8 family serine peptidase [Prosthecobacter sp.]
PFINRGFPSPSTTVYPAACRRVLGVSGVTADNKPYSKTDYARLAIHLFNPRSWFLMRGCAGPDGRYRSLNPFDQSRSSIDSVQVEALGKLRAQQISAPTPNVPWLVASGKEKVAPVGQGRRSGVSAAGGGTSSATPQVAGAAALWLASNERQIRAAGQWRSWQKAEATIHALLLSAQRQSSGDPAKAEQDERTDLGAGVLDARAALRHDFASICRRTSPELSLRFPTAACGAPPDSYDGSLSVRNMLIPSERFSAHGEHALLDLHLRYNRPDQLAQALETLYYNDALLYRWRKGAMPLNGKSRSVWFNPLNWVLHPVTAVRRVMYFGDEPGLRAQAKSDAQRALRRAKKLP